MAQHKIKINPRKGANAVYNDMRREDFTWVISQLERLMIETAERSISQDPLDQNLLEYWTTSQKDLGYSPKHQRQNTAQSVVGGVLKNIRLGSSRDLTDKICDKIQIIFSDIAHGQQKNLFPDLKITPVEWEVLGESTAPTVFDNLFEVQS